MPRCEFANGFTHIFELFHCGIEKARTIVTPVPMSLHIRSEQGLAARPSNSFRRQKSSKLQAGVILKESLIECQLRREEKHVDIIQIDNVELFSIGPCVIVAIALRTSAYIAPFSAMNHFDLTFECDESSGYIMMETKASATNA
jgi:hypothetical protein